MTEREIYTQSSLELHLFFLRIMNLLQDVH